MPRRRTVSPEAPANGEPAALTPGTVDRQLWLRPNGNVRVHLDAEGTREEVRTQLQAAIDYLNEVG